MPDSVPASPPHSSPAWAEASALIDAAERVLVVTHVKPDGDAIGSLLGLTVALRERGKHVDAAVDEGVPTGLRFLASAADVQARLRSGAWDVMVSVDASDEARTGSVGTYGRTHSTKVINLDHHPTNTRFGDVHLVVPHAVSAAEIVFDWLAHMSAIKPSQAVAQALLTGMVTDTLGFRTSNVTPRTLEIAQALMTAGASLTEITARTLDARTFSTIRLWAEVLGTVDLTLGVASAVVSQAALKKAQMFDTTDGGLVSLLISAEEAMVAAVFKELSDGKVEVSLRAKRGYDVSQVALGVGGGGHKQASGATIDGPLEVARARLHPMLIDVVKTGILIIA